MEYEIYEKYILGQRKYFVNSEACSGREIGPFIYKRSARKCIKILKTNQKIMMLVSHHVGMTEEIEEQIFELLEQTVDRVGE